MKKLFLKLAFVLGLVCSPVCAFAQGKTVVRAGTVVDLQSVNTVYARNVEIGDNVKFSVTSNVMSEGKVLYLPAR